MKVVRILRGKREDTNKDPRPTPDWLADPEHVQPCPCSEPPDETVILFEGHGGLSRWLHARCLDWIENEMDDEEIAAKREWEKQRRKLKEGFEEPDDDE